MLLAAAAAAAFTAERLHVVHSGAVIPHPAKVGKGGEDAFVFDDEGNMFGVADGVGGSATATVDPGAFSREMLERCHQSAKCGLADALPEALGLASGCPLSGEGGSSTLVLGQLETGTNTMRLLNLGDSGAMVLRPATREASSGGKQLWPRVVLRTHDQTHGFNWPYQTRARTFEKVGEQVDEVSTVVKPGDIVIAASDGVFDNLFDDALQFLVAERLDDLHDKNPASAQAAADALAQCIAEQAIAIGQMGPESGLDTPFSKEARAEGRDRMGGKLDDVAVVCGLVRAGERPTLRMGHNFGGAPSVEEQQAQLEAVPTPPAVPKPPTVPKPPAVPKPEPPQLEPPTMAPSWEEAPQATAPVRLTVPQGLTAGMQMIVDWGDTRYDVTVPMGCGPGSEFDVQLPVLQPRPPPAPMEAWNGAAAPLAAVDDFHGVVVPTFRGGRDYTGGHFDDHGLGHAWRPVGWMELPHNRPPSRSADARRAARSAS